MFNIFNKQKNQTPPIPTEDTTPVVEIVISDNTKETPTDEQEIIIPNLQHKPKKQIPTELDNLLDHITPPLKSKKNRLKHKQQQEEIDQYIDVLNKSIKKKDPLTSYYKLYKKPPEEVKEKINDFFSFVPIQKEPDEIQEHLEKKLEHKTYNKYKQGLSEENKKPEDNKKIDTKQYINRNVDIRENKLPVETTLKCQECQSFSFNVRIKSTEVYIFCTKCLTQALKTSL